MIWYATIGKQINYVYGLNKNERKKETTGTIKIARASMAKWDGKQKDLKKSVCLGRFPRKVKKGFWNIIFPAINNSESRTDFWNQIKEQMVKNGVYRVTNRLWTCCKVFYTKI